MMAKKKASVRTSMLSRFVSMLSIRVPSATALITLCKPVMMADNWSNKQEGGHAGHRRSGSSLR
jgi:hypothetical protein